MFDNVRFTMPCPICGKDLDDWQSKSGNCYLKNLTPAELWKQRHPDPLGYDDHVDWYENCENCATWVEVRIKAGTMVDPEYPKKLSKSGYTVTNYQKGPDLTKAIPTPKSEDDDDDW